jgi:predicted NBD/HSP70 family sugar kinase
MTLKTLADVRALMRHLPEDRQARSTWRHVADQLAQAAAGAVDPAHVAIALRLVLSMEGVECRPQ